MNLDSYRVAERRRLRVRGGDSDLWKWRTTEDAIKIAGNERGLRVKGGSEGITSFIINCDID